MGEETSGKRLLVAMREETLEDKSDASGSCITAEKAPDVNSSSKKPLTESVIGWDDIETRISVINAWVDFKKTKAEIRAHKQLLGILAWERTKIASKEDRLEQIKAKLEKKKAKDIERLGNKIAIIHKVAEEKRQMVEAERHEKLFKAEKMAAKYRATLFAPKKLVGCF